MTEPAVQRLTYVEYLAREEQSEVRHEFFAGRAFAMAGGTPLRALVSGNVLFQLKLAFRGGPCRVYGSDLRVRVSETGLSTYPDVSLVCGELQHDALDPHAVTNPLVLVEVLSEGTEAYDRGQKFAHYRRLDSLQHYLMVSTTQQRVEHYRRDEQGEWVLRELDGQGVLHLGEVEVPVAGFFEDSEVPAVGTAGLR